MKFLTRKIRRNKILESVTPFVTSQCVTQFYNSGIRNPFLCSLLQKIHSLQNNNLCRLPHRKT